VTNLACARALSPLTALTIPTFVQLPCSLYLCLLDAFKLRLRATSPSVPPTTTAYIPTNFAILAHHAWHTLTLGLGTKNSKATVFIFESTAMKAAWPGVVPLGDVGHSLIRAVPGSPEMARFKF
jgi:hypothetical protein